MDQDRITGGANQFAGKVEEGIGNLTGDTKSQAEGIADQVIGKAQSTMGRARDAMRGVVDSVSDQARSAGAGVQDQASSIGEAIEATVREQPVLAVATAAAVGYVLAFLIHRR